MSGAVEQNPLPDVAYVVALAGLPEVGPARLRALLDRGHPADVLGQLAGGGVVADAALAQACGRADPTPLLDRWRSAAAGADVAELWRSHLAAGIEVLTAGDEGWPAALLGDSDPPVLLFARGRPAVLDRAPARVAVVGTRRCSRYGWDVAHHLGRELARAGVVVVSGLAAGIDAAAHRGALAAGPEAAPPVGVVGTGLDVAYPAGNAGLWDEVAAAGVVLSEAPLGTRPSRWRFPARNRIIAALADAVVVVESAAAGGALHTVDEAAARDRVVLAVPGPITSAVSVGTNRLLLDAALPVCDVDDVLLAVGIGPVQGPRPVGDADLPAGDDSDQRATLDALGSTPATLDALSARAGLPLGRVAAAVARLEGAGVVVASSSSGSWERVHRGTGR